MARFPPRPLAVTSACRVVRPRLISGAVAFSSRVEKPWTAERGSSSVLAAVSKLRGARAHLRTHSGVLGLGAALGKGPNPPDQVEVSHHPLAQS